MGVLLRFFSTTYYNIIFALANIFNRLYFAVNLLNVITGLVRDDGVESETGRLTTLI